jgi:DNA-binding GntR family transcriptional regulator
MTSPGSSLTVDGIGIDRDSPVPLYYQLAQHLERAIDAGDVARGARLDNEAQLAAKLGLSRPTVRRAIQYLVDKGLLVRKRGVGTNVAHPKVRRGVELTSLYDDLLRNGQRPTTKVLANAVRPADPAIAAALGLPDGEPVVALERLRFAFDEPIALLRNYLPATVGGLSGEALERTGLYELMRGAGLRLHAATQSIGARAATSAEARLLGEARRAPLLTMERTVYDDEGRPVEHGSHLYRATRYCFEQSLLAR